ncbi:MAG: hypothetical protein IMZ71_03085 [Chloroflexi bacterium]|nr:hypothetical protein [Chloroflexota bacterium]
MLGAHDHSNPGQGGQIDPETGLNPQPVVDFGDGSDGNHLVAGVEALMRDMSYNNLTVPVATGFVPMGYKIKVKGILIIEAGSSIWTRGQVGQPGAAGVGGAGGGCEYEAARLPEACLPTGGAAGGDGGAAGVNFSVSNIPPDPGFVNDQPLFEGRLWAGAGGAGGGAVGNAPTAGGIPTRVLAGAKGGRGADAI